MPLFCFCSAFAMCSICFRACSLFFPPPFPPPYIKFPTPVDCGLVSMVTSLLLRNCSLPLSLSECSLASDAIDEAFNYTIFIINKCQFLPSSLQHRTLKKSDHGRTCTYKQTDLMSLMLQGPSCLKCRESHSTDKSLCSG